MREADDDDKALVEEVFESAIRSIGMKRVFSAVSARGATANATDQGSGASLLGIDPALQLPDEIPYLWLLRLLKNSIRNESLSIFTDDLLPTVTSLHSRLVPLHPAKVELFSEIEGQIWDLLPSFLMSAPDFSEVFPKLAQKLVATFDERRDLRLAVISSIRAAIK
ncbi:Protein Y46E12BL.2 [Aphelenchoides avenae]|nr:Protein Y46E12BL.2 [Aphelenchus avenae]